MALSKLTAMPAQELTTCAVDVSEYAGEPMTLTFREPSTADLFAVPVRLERLQASFPDFPAGLVKQVLILGGCYVPDSLDEPGTDPDAVFAGFARDNRDMFLVVLGQFVSAFPIATALSATRAGNG